MLTCRFLQTTAAAALLAGTAHATDAAGTADPATAAEASGTQQGFGDPSETGGLAEIVVTAQKSSENLQKTAAAVTSVSGDALVASGITDIRAAQVLIPSVRFQQQNTATEVYIRGVG